MLEVAREPFGVAVRLTLMMMAVCVAIASCVGLREVSGAGAEWGASSGMTERGRALVSHKWCVVWQSGPNAMFPIAYSLRPEQHNRFVVVGFLNAGFRGQVKPSLGNDKERECIIQFWHMGSL